MRGLTIVSANKVGDTSFSPILSSNFRDNHDSENTPSALSIQLALRDSYEARVTRLVREGPRKSDNIRSGFYTREINIWPINDFDLQAHLSMVAFPKPLCFRGKMPTISTHCIRASRTSGARSGALEEDAVYTILTCIWRKRRIRDKRNLDTLAALQRQDLNALSEKPVPFFNTKQEKTLHLLANRPNSGGRPRHEDKVSQLVGFSSSLYGMLDGQFLEVMIGMLGGEPSAHLKREVPKENYSTTPEWVQAVKREVDEVLLPRARAEMDGPDSLAAKAAEFITTDRILEDLALEERLDAMVDRAMRRLAQMKFMKQVSGSNERRLLSVNPLQIEGTPKEQIGLAVERPHQECVQV
jgi:hypothetical protein